MKWSVDDVVSFLEEIKIPTRVIQQLREHDIKGNMLRSMLKDDELCKELGISRVHHLKITAELPADPPIVGRRFYVCVFALESVVVAATRF